MKKIIMTLCLMAAIICCLSRTGGIVYADTDGTELQVAQPSSLEIQLGSQWVGVEFELKTDAGIYPGTVEVGDDGVLRMELGGSATYTLSCLNSGITVPLPEETQAPATNKLNAKMNAPEEIPAAEGDAAADGTDIDSPNAESVKSTDEGEASISGIPVKHIILFGGGMILAVGSLITIRIIKKRSTSSNQSDDEYDDYND